MTSFDGRRRASPSDREHITEDRLLREVFRHPERLRERLVLAIALAPPKAKAKGTFRPHPTRRR